MTIEVDYRFPAGVDAERAARAIAIGQTAGSWDARFEHRADALRAHLGEVRGVRALEDGGALATVAFPERNVEGDVPTLLTMIYGKCSMAGPARVVALRLPEGYGRLPRFGAAGIRERLGVRGRPLVMAIFKPALGLSAAEHAGILREVALAGLDVIKDDEILGDLDSAPTLERIAACGAVLDEVEARTGRRPLYAVNLTASGGRLGERARELVAAGAGALLLNVLAYGFGALEEVAADPEVDLPIFAHPALAGAWAGSATHGVAWGVLLGTLLAHAGADAVLHPAAHGSLSFERADELAIRDALRARGALPVPSAGIHPGVVPLALADYGEEVVLNAGTGIMDHPGGPADGVRAFFEALERATPGEPFDAGAIPEGPLRAALGKWGAA